MRFRDNSATSSAARGAPLGEMANNKEPSIPTSSMTRLVGEREQLGKTGSTDACKLTTDKTKGFGLLTVGNAGSGVLEREAAVDDDGTVATGRRSMVALCTFNTCGLRSIGIRLASC